MFKIKYLIWWRISLLILWVYNSLTVIINIVIDVETCIYYCILELIEQCNENFGSCIIDIVAAHVATSDRRGIWMVPSAKFSIDRW